MYEVDTEFLGAAIRTEATEAFKELSLRLDACGSAEGDIHRWSACAIERLVGLEGMKPTRQPASVEAHTASFAIATREGSCAAIVAAVLALTEPYDEPFEAVVLRDHVVLAVRERPGIYFEVLEGGRTLTDMDLRRHKFPPSGIPVRVRGREYVAYYLDNLAARLADAGEPAKTEVALRKALGFAPGSGRIHFNLGTLFLQTKRFHEAAEHLKLAISLGWDDADARVNRGVALWKLGRLRAARRSFERALAKEPGNRQALANLKTLRTTQGR